MTKKYDIIIIGGGAAGFTAGIYASRRGLKTLIISKDIGGQASLTCEIENYPAVGLVEGPDLMQRFRQDAQKFGTEFMIGEVNHLERQTDNEFIVKTDQGDLQAVAIILSFGLTPRDLNIPGEKEFKHRGVFYTALLNPESFTDKNTTVIGGGNSALISAITLAQYAKTINLVHRRNEFRAEDVLLARLKNLENIKLYLDKIPLEIKGDNSGVKELVITAADDSKSVDIIATDNIFINVGFIAQAKWLGDLVDYSTNNHIVIDKYCKTKTPGLFAAGDITDLDYKQVIISAGDGAKAAISAYEYLKKIKGYTSSSIDWGHI